MIKVGIDLDGVVFDSEQTFRTYEEIFDIEHNQNKLINREEPKYQGRYSWSIDEQNEFKKYFIEVSKASNIMPGFIKVYELIKKLDVELIVITARGLTPDGGFIPEMEEDAKRLLSENRIEFDKYYWKQSDKTEVAKKENIDIMIDDDYKIIEKFSQNKIKSLYFRDVNLKELEENEYIKEVNNWGDIYRYIIKMIKED